MNIAEAFDAILQGQRVRSPTISIGAVVKLVQRGWDPPQVRVVFEATGDSYAFQNSPADQAAEWEAVQGWASYDLR